MFYITYFYNVRFLAPTIIPLSTAVWDPKWFHNFQDSYEVFYDKRGVLNGLRIDVLSPSKIYDGATDCEACDHSKPESCAFLRKYTDYLHTVDFNKVLLYCDKIKEAAKLPEADICLLVYEKPDNPCSERTALCNWFKENGHTLQEWKNN